MVVLSGKELSSEIENEVSRRVADYRAKAGGRAPILATILVGDDPASATYVRMKQNACRRVGLESRRIELPAATRTEELLAEIQRLNEDEEVQGILLQHPVPDHIDERECFDAIRLAKDVDGVTSLGFGRLSMGLPAFGSATPAGILRLLRHYEIELEGRLAVVVGRSPILGKPMAAMLLNANATVVVCHSKTRNLPEILRQADIVVGAVGRPEFIRGEWIRDGAVVVDAGYHPGQVGDIELAAVADRSAAYTPVPGGVGPMTIATLLEHTMIAAERSLAAAEAPPRLGV
jgi:methylenetetrahydrofolate dehydrogenase (NADP+) / methenyltetrahydrofolate cyclohydrolase